MAPMPPILNILFARGPSPSSIFTRLTRRDDALSNINAQNPATNDFQDATVQALSKRDTNPSYNPGSGSISPSSFNNAGMLALFAILGVAMAVASIWFFFYAKNGGFRWRKGDWEDYKSTVLRRKGPDGKTLSNATKSTKLGGGTIAGSHYYQRYLEEKSLAQSVVGRDEKGRKGIVAKRGWGHTHSVMYDNSYQTETFGTKTVSDEMTEVRSEPDYMHVAQNDESHHSKRYRDRDVRSYKKEKPARVGGLNRVADGSHFDYTNSDRSDILTESVVTDAMTENSEQPMLQSQHRDESDAAALAQQKAKEKARAERKAREEAARMERRWKRDAEAAAAALARENRQSRGYAPAPASIDSPPPSRRSANPSKQPGASKQRRSSRNPSPSRRDFSYQTGPASEVLSTVYTSAASSNGRKSSYYDEYRPRAEQSRYAESEGQSEPVIQSPPRTSRRAGSPRKKPQSSARREGGYRRGGADSDLE